MTPTNLPAPAALAAVDSPQSSCLHACPAPQDATGTGGFDPSAGHRVRAAMDKTMLNAMRDIVHDEFRRVLANVIVEQDLPGEAIDDLADYGWDATVRVVEKLWPFVSGREMP